MYYCLLGFGQLWPDCGYVCLSHTPTGFGLAVKTKETLLMSQNSSKDCEPVPLVYQAMATCYLAAASKVKLCVAHLQVNLIV